MRRDQAGRSPLYLAAPWVTMAVSGAVILILMAAPVMVSPERWLGSFPDTMSAFALTSVLAGVAISSVGAWIGGQQRRWGADAWSHVSGRSTSELHRTSLRAVLCLAVGCYLLVLTSLTGLTLWRGGIPPQGSLHLLVVPAAVVASGAALAGFGVLLGRTLPRYAAMPTAAAVPYAAYFVSVFYSGIPGIHLLTAGETRAWTYAMPNFTTVGIEAGFWVAMAIASGSACLGHWTWSKRCSLVASAVLAVAILSGEKYVDVPGSTSPVCRTGDVTVCTDRAHGAVLGEYAEQVSSATSVLPPGLRPERIVSDSSLRTGAADLVAPPLRGNTSPAFVIDRDVFRVSFGDEVLGRCLHSGGDTSSHAQDVTSFLLIWWRIRAGVDPSVQMYPGAPRFDPSGPSASMSDRARSFSELSLGAQTAWLQKYASDLRACSLRGVELP